MSRKTSCSVKRGEPPSGNTPSVTTWTSRFRCAPGTISTAMFARCARPLRILASRLLQGGSGRGAGAGQLSHARLYMEAAIRILRRRGYAQVLLNIRGTGNRRRVRQSRRIVDRRHLRAVEWAPASPGATAMSRCSASYFRWWPDWSRRAIESAEVHLRAVRVVRRLSRPLLPGWHLQLGLQQNLVRDLAGDRVRAGL